MRISSRAYFNALSANLNSTSERLAQLSQQISSGRRLAKPSDDPMAVRAVVDARADLATVVNRQKALAKGDILTTMSDAVLDEISSALRRAQDIALAGSQPGLDGNGRAAMASELRSIRHSVFDQANVSVAGDYIFSGRLGEQPPFEEVGGVVSYAGQPEGVQIWVAPGRAMEVTVPGDRLFNFEDAGGDRAVGSVDNDLFGLLEDLAVAIESGDNTAVEARSVDLQALAGHAIEQRGVLGARAARIEDAEIAAGNMEVRANEILSEAEGVDLVAAIVELENQKLAYQSALSATAKLAQLPTLFELNW